MTKWWKDATVYQIYPRSFNDSNGDGIGDINGITEKLPYLKELGIDVIWLSPVYQSPNDDNGYDISDYEAIMDEFGTMNDYEQMLLEAKRLDLKIMMDLVVNHTSDEHQWFIESKKSKTNDKRAYYIWHDPKTNGEPPTQWAAAFGGSVWEYDETSEQYYLHLFSKKQPDLNWESDAMRQDVYRMMRNWLDKGVAGFRMDVINMISKDPTYPEGKKLKTGYTDGSPYYFNGPKVHAYLQEMRREALSGYDTITVGEMPNVSVDQAKLYTAEERKELDMVFHFDHVGLGDGELGKWTPKPWKLTDLKQIFSRWQEGLDEVGWNSLYWSNHDQPRALSRFGNDQETYRVKSGKMLATCLHMLKGTPYVFQGEEIGMTNVQFSSLDDYRDLESINAFHELTEKGLLTEEEMMEAIYKRGRDNARTPMQWSNQVNAGFTSGTPWIGVNPNYRTINVHDALAKKDSLFYYYQKLIKLRKTHEIIVEGRYHLLYQDREDIYVYKRVLNDQTLIVLTNFTDQTVTVDLPYQLMMSDCLITNEDEAIEKSDAGYQLKPYGAYVFLLN
ncbi:alpha-glucosidase [Halolactibacillus alkaliphilus]|uniref:oligo-1,6-glucosidase n=1 Tax=Halolactibacillus alkaliphilus TaxID=442899 RepID=A0A511X3V2_9BACI|nr:alpha-glucosidase [Halolactibacillus alkaliphilus]GEN57630.1 alpha-glucosidase [Halolactibacillus alkaliphilus]GGN74302.1 alpha-glucosidase [Halolactibacillus alkaliphilus]SFP01093.1 oligo-1,6-glucosidase [Halolactibacillus alkaliphilus]